MNNHKTNPTPLNEALIKAGKYHVTEAEAQAALNRFQHSFRSGAKARHPLTSKLMLAAAVVGLIFTLSTVWYFLTPQSLDQLVASANFSLNTAALSTSMGSAEVTDLRAKAVKAYDRGSYEESITYFSRLLATDPRNSNYALFLGDSYLKSNHLQSAIQAFQQALEISLVEKQSSIYYCAEYYLGLAYIKNKQFEMGRKLLENTVKQGDSKLSRKAQLLLDNI